MSDSHRQSAARQPPPIALPASGISASAPVIVSVGILYVGREILIPLALAVLLGFVLTPPLLWLRRRRVPRVIGVALVVAVAAAAIGGLVIAVGAQVMQLADKLPSYRHNIEKKLAALKTQVCSQSSMYRKRCWPGSS